MRLTQLEVSGFKSFAKKGSFEFSSAISAIVGPNGSGKSNVVESIRFVTGEQSIKTMRGKKGEDLIFNGSQTIPRASTGKVEIVFDNKDRSLPIDFDEVTIAREVARDGTNAYYVNDSQVRLRDVYELLSAANIGASSHHIISQGEADRVLSAGTKERKAMLEDALGLRIYQWKILESKKKLEKTEQNIKEAESLRREIAPHLKYLKKQVEKISEVRSLRETVRAQYKEYLKREELYLEYEHARINHEKKTPEEALREIENELKRLEADLAKDRGGEAKEYGAHLSTLRAKISELAAKKDELSRSIGRLEGMIEFMKSDTGNAASGEKTIRVREVLDVVHRITKRINEALQAMDWDVAMRELEEVAHVLRDFEDKLSDEEVSAPVATKKVSHDISQITKECEETRAAFSVVEKEEREVREEEAKLLALREEAQDTSRASERSLYELKAKKASLAVDIEHVRNAEDRFLHDETAFKEECREAEALTGMLEEEWKNFHIEGAVAGEEPRSAQEDRHKALERLKIKLEDAGGAGGEDVMKEHDAVSERDAFLERELGDLKKSAEALSELIVELSGKIDTEFQDGVKRINKQFQEFFVLMFGGGTAALSAVKEVRTKRKTDEVEDEAEDNEEDTQVEEGVDISVSLPHKKVKGLMMLSGGERALTSIALLFAMSQVNPPPFLVLDETDAALDEANSRKYGDMLENLARVCQLIVITHNRETMSRAGILYGVTMGKDAASKILSVKFEEAAAIAK